MSISCAPAPATPGSRQASFQKVLAGWKPGRHGGDGMPRARPNASTAVVDSDCGTRTPRRP